MIKSPPSYWNWNTTQAPQPKTPSLTHIPSHWPIPSDYYKTYQQQFSNSSSQKISVQTPQIFKDTIKWHTKNITFPLLQIQKSISVTRSAGLNFTVSLGPIMVTAQYGFSTDTKGMFAIQRTFAVGPTGSIPPSPIGLSASIYIMTTNSPSINQLEGLGYLSGGSVALPLLAGYEVNVISDQIRNTSYRGFTMLIGFGTPGMEAHFEVGDTETLFQVNTLQWFEETCLLIGSGSL